MPVKSLLDKAKTFMCALSAMPETVLSYFRHPSTAYAYQGI